MSASPNARRLRDWPRRYPPLTVVVVALALAVFALPSALNLPQANPSQTLEYAPVPGEQGNTSNGGNFAGLGLGTGGASSGVAGLPLPPPVSDNAPLSADLPNQGSRPSTKQCVGNPPRQTEDPLSPPCVAFYTGDNGGATYPGVTRDQVKVLFYSDSNFQDANCNTSNPPADKYYDLAQPADASENTCITTLLRVWQRYFNQRFQTYNRSVHFYLYFSRAGSGPATAQDRRADAQDNLARIHPFAVLPLTTFLNGNLDAYERPILEAGSLVFVSNPFQPSSFYRKFAPRLWGYAPSLEQQAKSFVSYVCTKVANQPTSFAGSFPNGQKRVYGLVHTTDPTATLVRQYQDYTAAQLTQTCGIQFADTAEYPLDGYFAAFNNDPNYNSYAPGKMAQFKQEKITTLIWPGGYETQFSKAATSLKYAPEWVVAGDGVNDGFGGGHYQEPSAWAHAAVVTPVPRMPVSGVPDACKGAWEESDPNAADYTTIEGYGCFAYPAIRQLFTGIQVAGPRLTPAAMDQGYHAIPPYVSHDPQQPACFYETGDYTCVKDAQALYWDNAGYTGSNPGCYRMVQGGARYSAGRWPGGNVTDQRTANDPCNQNFGTGQIQITANTGTP